MWCEDLGKHKSDKTKHFQNGIHLLKSHHHQRNIFGQDGIGVESIVKEKTYIKLKINRTESLLEQVNELLSKSYFARYIYQLRYLAKFSKNGNGEKMFFTNGLNQILFTITRIKMFTTHYYRK